MQQRICTYVCARYASDMICQRWCVCTKDVNAKHDFYAIAVFLELQE